MVPIRAVRHLKSCRRKINLLIDRTEKGLGKSRQIYWSNSSIFMLQIQYKSCVIYYNMIELQYKKTLNKAETRKKYGKLCYAN